MSSGIDRRQFLRMLIGLLSSYAVDRRPPPAKKSTQGSAQTAPNVLIVLFDAFSATNASLHGYPRETTPNLAQFAASSTFYHRNYAAGNFTNPGTASLLSGAYPWTHRALHLHESVAEGFRRRSLFRAFESGGYHRVGYSHNLQVSMLLHDFRHDLDTLKMTRELCLLDSQLSDRIFPDDYNAAVWRERLFRGGFALDALPTSILLFWLSRKFWLCQVRRLQQKHRDAFPRGTAHPA